MRLTIILLILFFAGAIQGQDLAKDLLLIKSEAIHEHTEVKSKNSFFKGILKIYSNHISDQILNDCIYHESCSEFSQGAIREFGIFKGTFLTMDRMMRCNRMSQSETLPVRFNEIGKISDHWYQYGKED